MECEEDTVIEPSGVHEQRKEGERKRKNTHANTSERRIPKKATRAQ